jgi:tetratricopeptide (TPR) repeat protein
MGASPPPVPLCARAPGRRLRAGLAVGLAAATFALYAPVRRHAFVDWDDDRTIVRNPALRLPLDARAALRALEPYEASWVPLTRLSLHLDYRLHGLRPAGYLLENAALHAGAAAVLFLALASLTGAAGRSAFVAAVFAVHPLQVESVAWASQRQHVLSGLFWMLGLLAYARYAARPALARYSLVLGSLAAGLLAGPTLLTFPFALLLLDFWPLGRLCPGSGARAGAEARRALLEKLPMLLLASGVAVATWLAQRSPGAMAQLDPHPLAYRLANAAESTVAYVADAFWPAALAVLYPEPGLAISPWRAAACALALVLATVAALRTRYTRPYLAVGWLWYLGTLAPALGIVALGPQARADRYSYLPLVGLAIATAWGAVDLAQGRDPARAPGPGRARARVRKALAAAALVALAALAAAARLQLRHWRDSVALFQRAVAVAPESAPAHHHLGLALVSAGRPLDARPHLERALALGADSAAARAGLALAYEQLGHYPESIAHDRAALRIERGQRHATLHLARVLAACPDPELRDPTEAVRLAEAAQERARSPDAELYDVLATAYSAAGRHGEALRAAERALSLAEVAGDAERARALRAWLARYRARGAGAAPSAGDAPAGSHRP